MFIVSLIYFPCTALKERFLSLQMYAVCVSVYVVNGVNYGWCVQHNKQTMQANEGRAYHSRCCHIEERSLIYQKKKKNRREEDRH